MIYEAMQKSHDAASAAASAAPDAQTRQTVMRTLADCGDVAGAVKVFEDMKQPGRQQSGCDQSELPDDGLLQSLLDQVRKTGQTELGLRIFRDMVARGFRPSEYTLVALLKLLGRASKHQEARRMLENWQVEFFAQKKPTVVHHTCLIR